MQEAEITQLVKATLPRFLVWAKCHRGGPAAEWGKTCTARQKAREKRDGEIKTLKVKSKQRLRCKRQISQQLMEFAKPDLNQGSKTGT